MVPQVPASATCTYSSGSQRSRQLSRKVPVLARPHGGLAPADGENAQPVQQPAAGRVVVLAQVELQLPLLRLRLEPERALLTGEIALQGYGGGGVRDFTEGLADDQPVLDERERHIGAFAHHGTDRVRRLAQPGQRAATHGGQRLGEPDGLDDMGGRHEPVLVAHESGDLGHPPLDGAVRGVEEVSVPAGRVDARAVTAVPGEPPVRPGHPGQLGLDLGQPLEQGAVGGERGPRAERGYVPGTADDRDVVAELLHGLAQLNAHVRLADGVTGMAAVPVHLAQGGHRLGEGGERCPRVDGLAVPGAVFDDVLPPALRVVVARRTGEHTDGVDRGPRGRALRPLLTVRSLVLLGSPVLVTFPVPLRHGQGVGCGQVDEPDRDTVFKGPADRDPLGRERGQRPERRLPRVVDGVGEQRDRGPHPLVGRQRQQCVGLRRPFHEHGLRAGGVQRGADGAGRARSVVPHPQQQRSRRALGPGHFVLGRFGPGHADTSRQAR